MCLSSSVIVDWVLILAVYHHLTNNRKDPVHNVHQGVVICRSSGIPGQGPYSQYRSVVVDSLAYFHRASEAEQFLYKQSFTVNPTGAVFGNTATGKNQVGDVTGDCTC
jgi:hypothetical protein